jgi:hypothetical protein
LSVDSVSEGEQWAKINVDRKRSLYIEKDCSEKSQSYCSTGGSRTEDPVSTKSVERELPNPASLVGLQLIKAA